MSRPQAEPTESCQHAIIHPIPSVTAAKQPPALKMHQLLSLTPLTLAQDLKHFNNAGKPGLFRVCVHSMGPRSGRSPAGKGLSNRERGDGR